MKVVKSLVNERHAVPDSPQMGIVTIEQDVCYYLEDPLADLLVGLERAVLIDVEIDGDHQHGSRYNGDVELPDDDENGSEGNDDTDNKVKGKKPWMKN